MKRSHARFLGPAFMALVAFATPLALAGRVPWTSSRVNG